MDEETSNDHNPDMKYMYKRLILYENIHEYMAVPAQQLYVVNANEYKLQLRYTHNLQHVGLF